MSDLQAYIDEQNAAGNGLHIGVILPEELSDASWSIVLALSDIVSDQLGAQAETSCSVSSTCGASDVAFMVGARLVCVYLTVNESCPI
jgi:hypothetical protein